MRSLPPAFYNGPYSPVRAILAGDSASCGSSGRPPSIIVARDARGSAGPARLQLLRRECPKWQKPETRSVHVLLVFVGEPCQWRACALYVFLLTPACCRAGRADIRDAKAPPLSASRDSLSLVCVSRQRLSACADPLLEMLPRFLSAATIGFLLPISCLCLRAGTPSAHWIYMLSRIMIDRLRESISLLMVRQGCD